MVVFSYTLQVVALGAVLVGIITGILSVFFVSRKQSILGDAIAHASLAGIATSFLLTGSTSRVGLLAGALVSALLTVICIQLITSYTRVKSDAAIGIILSTFFGLGIVLISVVQQSGISAQVNLRHYLFGNIAYLRINDLVTILLLGLIVIGMIFIFWKELKLISFDPEFANTLGLRTQWYELLILILVVITVVIGVELIGVVMMAGLLIAPGIAARQWSDVFGRVVLLAGVFGGLAGAGGAMASATISNLPAGPTIIVIMGVIVIFSLIFARKGWLWSRLRYLRFHLLYDVEESLEHLATHMLINPRECDIREFAVSTSHSITEEVHSKDHHLHDDLQVLQELGYINPREGGTWILTLKGMQMVESMSNQLQISQQINQKVNQMVNQEGRL